MTAAANLAPMPLHRLRNLEQFHAFQRREAVALAAHQAASARLQPATERDFTVRGFSYTAGREVDFLCDFLHSGGSGKVLWRERVCCPQTSFNNRMRATFHLFDIEMDAYPDQRIYVTEQVTPIFRYFAARFPDTVGSEYLGDSVPRGARNAQGVRNEDLTALTFDDASFDAIVSLDVFEHIPDYPAAFRECARVLAPGGRMLWSVPFIPTEARNYVRARLVDGQVQHILPPEYHGDPVTGQGILCFQHFGWEMLDQMRAAGFADAYALCLFSIAFGYIGDPQFLFIARK